MATRLYFHNALNTQSGSYSQGLVYDTIGYGIAYGDGVYICHNGTQIQRSTDGVDWDDAISVSTNTEQIYGIAFGNGIFMVVVANGAAIYKSTDLGLTWTLSKASVPGPTSQNFMYRNGWWFNCCDNATLMISNNDGSTWANATLTGIAGTQILYYVGYSSTTGEYVVSSGSNNLWFTTNPAGSWTQVTGAATNSTSKVVAWNNDLWIIVLSQGSVYTTPTMSATPTWTLRTVTGGNGTSAWRIETAGSTTVVAGNALLYVSTNGTDWTNYNNTSGSPGMTPLQDTQIWYGSAYDGTAFWIFSAVSIIMRSTDGATWRRTGGPMSTTTEFISSTPLAIPAATAYKMRTMNTTIGTAQASLPLTTWAGSTFQNNFIGFFASEPLAGAQTVGGGTMIFNIADLEANLASNWWTNGLCVYVWRPSTGAIVGFVRDYQGVSLGGLEPTAASSEQVTHITDITTSAVSAQSQDVIVCEIWVTATQGMATAYANQVFFDGTTVNTTENAAVTSQASFIEFTENLTFGTPSTANMLLFFY